MVNINIEVPDKLHKELKIISVEKENTMKEQVINALEKKVEKRKRTIKKIERNT